jgi:hypothetical protein
MPYFRSGLTKSGTVILDVRQRRAGAAADVMSELGTVSTLTYAAGGGAQRLMLRKAA